MNSAGTSSLPDSSTSLGFAVELAAQPELEAAQPVADRRLQPRQLLHVAVDAVVVERLQPAQDLVEVARVDAVGAQRPPQRLEVLAVAARLAAELAHVVGAEVARPRVAPAAVVVAKPPNAVAVAAAALAFLALLTRLARLTALAFLTLLARLTLALLPLLAGLALLSLLSLLTLLALLTGLALLPLLATLTLLLPC